MRSSAAEDKPAFDAGVKDVRNKLVDEHAFTLSEDDLKAISRIMKVFSQWGAGTNYASDSAVGERIVRGETNVFPTYAVLMTATDSSGKPSSYLASEDSYRFIRDSELKGLIVPVIGDFGGPKAVRAIGQFVRDHGAVVSTFYVSNVEQYLLNPPSA